MLQQDTLERSPDVRVPEMVEQLVKLPKTVSQDEVKQRTVECIVDTPVPQVVEELVELHIVEKTDETSEFDAGAGEDPFAKVKSSITGLISRLQFIDKVVDILVVAQRQPCCVGRAGSTGVRRDEDS